MTGELTLQGAFNIGVQGVAQGANVNITQVLAHSNQYNEILKQLELNKKLLALTPESEIQERLGYSAEINKLEAQIEQFKKDVLRLAEQFDRIEINTERLKRAKEHFDKGEISQARAIFEAESDAMREDQRKLLEKRAEYEENVLPKLRNNAEEYLLSALLSITDYKNPNRYNEAIEKFELSIKSLETKENLFQYATFMVVLGRVEEAEEIYARYLKEFGDELVGEEVVNIYINLGQVYFQTHDFPNAESSLNRALEILTQEDSKSFPNYKGCLGAATAGMAILLQFQTKYEESYKKYKEAIGIFAGLAAEDNLKYMPALADVQSSLGYLLRLMYIQDVAAEKTVEAEEKFKEGEETLKEAYLSIGDFEQKNNLTMPLTLVNNALNYGNLLLEKNIYDTAKIEYEFALKIIEDCLAQNPQLYLPKKAVLFNSLGVLTEREGKMEESQNYFTQAVEIGSELIQSGEQTHLVEYCMFLVNLADSYFQTGKEREDSINMAVEAAAVLFPAMEILPYTKVFLQKAVVVLQKWGLSDDEIDAKINVRINQMQAAQ